MKFVSKNVSYFISRHNTKDFNVARLPRQTNNKKTKKELQIIYRIPKKVNRIYYRTACLASRRIQQWRIARDSAQIDQRINTNVAAISYPRRRHVFLSHIY